MDKKDLVIGVPKEIFTQCRCVGFVPQMVDRLTKRGHRVVVQRDAGAKAYYDNAQYEEAGAVLEEDPRALWGEADVILKIRPPLPSQTGNKHELDLMKAGATIMGFLAPTVDAEIVARLRERKLTGFAMELVPRISRAQSMDALSTLSTIAGYRSAILAANLLGKFVPLLMTAAGTIQPANALVIGAGVAGLQAIATAHRLGARVSAFDTRPAVREQIESLGARFIAMELPEAAETKDGYALEASPEFIQKEMETIAAHLPKTDVVITTALVYGRKAPILINAEMVKMMPSGAVIIDIAAEQGGNCELTVPDRTIEKHGVTIHGAVELPSQMPLHTSYMYSKNILSAFDNLFAAADDSIDLGDEVNAASLVTYRGEIVR